MHKRFLPLLVVACLLAATVTVAQITNALPSEVIAANQELDHQLLEGHRLLDTDKVMGLFTSGPEVFFISPGRADLFKGRDQVRKSWEQFFATLQSIHGEINHIQYLPAGDGVIGVGQVTYYRQLKGYEPDQRIVLWTDFRHKENGKWVYVFRHAHLVNSSYVDSKQSTSSRNPPEVEEADNIDVVKKWYGLLDEQAFDSWSGLFAEDSKNFIGSSQQPSGHKTIIPAVKMIYAAFPDFSHKIENIFASRDYVVAQVLCTGTHLKTYMGIPPTNNKVEYKETFIFRMKNGKIQETYGMVDTLTMMKQLGLGLK